MPMAIEEKEALLAIARTFEQIGEAIERFAKKDAPMNHEEVTTALQSIARSVNQIHGEVSRLTR